MKETIRFKYVITSGQIGSFIAFDSFLKDCEKKKLEKIIINTNTENKFNIKDKHGNHQISKLLINNSFYNKSIKIVEKKLSKKKFEKYISNKNFISTKIFFKNFYNKKLHLDKNINIKNSSFMKIKNADIDKFNLPKNYCVIVAWSKRKEKKFSKKDWEELIKILKANNIKGIILNSYYRKDVEVPEHNLLIDMTGKTTLLESIEITKNANCYIGINGCLSVIAMQKYPRKCMIKSCVKNFKWFYCFYPKVKNIKRIFFNNINSKAKNNLIKQINK